MTYLLGIDVGTTSLKAGLFSADGQCVGIEREEYTLDTPSVERAQLDANFYWQACVRTITKLLKISAIDISAIAAISVSSQGETLIALDDQGVPLYPAIVWLDSRAGPQAHRLAAQFQKQVYEKTGIAEIIPTWPACKILWLKENEPEVFTKTRKFVLVQDYLIYRLTGTFASDGSISCTSLYFDIVQNRWWDEMLDAIGISVDQLPEIFQPGSLIANIQKSAAEETGLSTQTKVVNGGMDQAVGAIGAGNIRAGIISETTGSALAIQVTVENPSMDPHRSIPVYFHSIPGHYLLVPVCPTAGMSLKWFRDQFGQAEIQEGAKNHVDSYDLLTKLAETVPPGSDGLIMLPHLMGAFSPQINPAARGSFTGFTLRHTRAHFIRAVLEGVAFMLMRNVEYIEQAGIPIQEIISTGGGSRSHLWNQIKANVCNKPVITLQNEETGLLGNVILAGTAVHVFASIADGCAKMIKMQEKIDPTEERQDYLAAYKNYCELDEELAGYFQHLTGNK